MKRNAQPQVPHPPLRLGVSACLLGKNVRFDGGHSRDGFLAGQAASFVEFVPVCPEVEIGLGTPRPTIRLAREGGYVKLVRPSDGEDLTDRMRAWAEKRVARIASMQLSGFVLKKDSPTCGLERVRVYDENGIPSRDGRGLFAQVLTERLPSLPVEEEGRLHDTRLRENFFERAWAYERLRRLLTSNWSARDIVSFHSREKLLLMSHSPSAYAQLGRLVAKVKTFGRDEFAKRYERMFMRALAKNASRGRQVNVLQHIAGYFGGDLNAAERAEVGTLFEDFRQGFVPLATPLALVRHHVRRLEIDYIDQQSYLNPHPKELRLRSHVQ